MEFTKISKKVMLFVLVISNVCIYAAEEVESLDDKGEIWIRTSDGTTSTVLKKNWKENSLIWTIWEGDKDSGTKKCPIVLRQVDSELFEQINKLTQGNELNAAGGNAGLQLIKGLAYLGMDDLMNQVVFVGSEEIDFDACNIGKLLTVWFYFLGKNIEDYGVFQKLRVLVMESNPPREVKENFSRRFKVREVARLSRSTEVLDKVMAIEIMKELSFSEKQELKKIRSQERELSGNILTD